MGNDYSIEFKDKSGGKNVLKFFCCEEKKTYGMLLLELEALCSVDIGDVIGLWDTKEEILVTNVALCLRRGRTYKIVFGKKWKKIIKLERETKEIRKTMQFQELCFLRKLMDSLALNENDLFDEVDTERYDLLPSSFGR